MRHLRCTTFKNGFPLFYGSCNNTFNRISQSKNIARILRGETKSKQFEVIFFITFTRIQKRCSLIYVSFFQEMGYRILNFSTESILKICTISRTLATKGVAAMSCQFVPNRSLTYQFNGFERKTVFEMPFKTYKRRPINNISFTNQLEFSFAHIW